MRVAIYGSRQDGHAKVCLRLVRRLGWDCAGCLDDTPEHAGGALDGLPVLGGRDALGTLRERGVDGVVLGFGDGARRRRLLEPIREAGLALPVLFDPEASRADDAAIGEAVVVLRGAVVGDDVRVDDAALVNVGALLTHDVHVGAGASVGPGAVLSGRTTVEADAQLGAGVVLLPDARIGRGAVVGAGAVVIGEVDAGTTVVGVPARPTGAGA
jgi:UDP-perosamine 4-acetyltransferase